MSKHSTLVGGSNCERVINCPGSVALSSGVPNTSSSYADEGTMLHSVMTKMLDEDKSSDELIGFEELGHEFTPELEDELVLPAIDQFDEICGAMGGIVFETEQRVSFGDFLPGAFGTADIVGTSTRETLVLDWKFGRGVRVDAEENYQMMFYASAARKTKATRDLFAPDRPIRCVIVQPAFGEPTQWVTTHDQLDVFDTMLKAAVAKARMDDALLETGKWCRFCPAQPICPLKNELAGYALQQDLEHEMDGPEMGELVELAYEVETWVKSVLALGHQQLELGNPVDGYKLVDKRSSGRVCTDEKKLKARLQRLKVKIDEYMPRKLAGVGAVEKALIKHGLKPAEREKIMGDLYKEKPSSGTTMVKDDDPRPAVVVGETAMAKLASKLAG